VNVDGQGNLRGYAYGANIGWINFETNGAPQVSLTTGAMSGSVWSATCGWISLSNTFAYVQTDFINAGSDSDGNGLPDAWELANFGHLGVDPNADPDHDGMSNLQEYLAGTNPNDPTDAFRITSITRATIGANPTPFTTITWTSQPTRWYFVQVTLDNTSTNFV